MTVFTDNLTVLVVDDEPDICSIFRQFLEAKSNFQVITASDGAEALDIVKSRSIDCCFTDLSMPRMDGLQLTHEIHQYDNTIPVVVMTGYPSMDNMLQTVKNGVVDFLTKPIEMKEILLTINRVVKERMLFVDNILLKEEAQKSRRLQAVNQELEKKIQDLETVNLILREMDMANKSGEVFSLLVNLAGRVTPCAEAHFCIFAKEMNHYSVITSFYREPSLAVPNKALRNEVVGKVAADNIPLLNEGRNGRSSYIAIPVKIRSTVFGVLFAAMLDGQAGLNERHLYFLNFLAEKAGSLIENLALYENLYENLFSTLYAFVETIEARDPYTKQHSIRVSQYAAAIGRRMGCSPQEIDELNTAGNLHDIGKIGIPDHILLKPGRLTAEEFRTIQKHPVIGANIIAHLGMWTHEHSIIRHHHEKFDGSGYPDGLMGEQIPFLSRILSVADVYDALTTDRSYRQKMEESVAVNIITENSGTQFDPRVVDAFLDLHRNGGMSVSGCSAQDEEDVQAAGAGASV